MNRMSFLFITLVAAGLPTIVMAAAGGGGHHEGIPWGNLIVPQIVNLSLFLGVLLYFVKDPVKNYFSGRVQNFEKAKIEAEKAKLLAEQGYNDIKIRLDQLDQTSKRSVEEAKQDAQTMKQKIIQDAKDMAAKMDREAELFAQQELQRAVVALRTELLNKSVEIANDDLKSAQSADVDRGLRKQFVEKVQRVQV